MAQRLGMTPMPVPSRTLGDHQAEYVSLLGLLAATCSKIGREIYTLMKQEFGEVEEPVPPGTVGSSTMPQKRNPKLAQDVVAAAAQVRALVPLALEAMQTEHEADRTTSVMMNRAVSEACGLTGDILQRLIALFSGLQVFPERMRRNLDLSGGLIMAEALMLELGQQLGRQRAHDVIYDLAQAAVTEGTILSRVAGGRPCGPGPLERRADRRPSGPGPLHRHVPPFRRAGRHSGPRYRGGDQSSPGGRPALRPADVLHAGRPSPLSPPWERVRERGASAGCCLALPPPHPGPLPPGEREKSPSAIRRNRFMARSRTYRHHYPAAFQAGGGKPAGGRHAQGLRRAGVQIAADAGIRLHSPRRRRRAGRLGPSARRRPGAHPAVPARRRLRHRFHRHAPRTGRAAVAGRVGARAHHRLPAGARTPVSRGGRGRGCGLPLAAGQRRRAGPHGHCRRFGGRRLDGGRPARPARIGRPAACGRRVPVAVGGHGRHRRLHDRQRRTSIPWCATRDWCAWRAST